MFISVPFLVWYEYKDMKCIIGTNQFMQEWYSSNSGLEMSLLSIQLYLSVHPDQGDPQLEVLLHQCCAHGIDELIHWSLGEWNKILDHWSSV